MNIQRLPSPEDIERVLELDPRIARRKRNRKAIYLALAALVLGGAAAWYSLSGGATRAVSYQTSPVERGALTVTVMATGTIEPTTQVDVSSEMSGVVRTVNVDNNSLIKKGDVLAELDVERLNAQAARAKAALAASEAKLVDARATVDEREHAFARQTSLKSKGFSAEQDLEVARAARDRAVAAVSSAEADIEVARADYDLQQIDIKKSRILSPINGIVLKRSVEPGQTVASSLQAPVLFTLAEDLTRMQVEAQVDEADIGVVKAGQSATFTVDAYSDRKFPAKIETLEFSPRTADGVVTYNAILSVDNSELLLRPGMTATAQIVIREIPDALLVPNAALRFAPSQPKARESFNLLQLFMPRPPRQERATKTEATSGDRMIWVLRDGKPAPIVVSAGASDGKITEIARGDLEPGEDVISPRGKMIAGPTIIAFERVHKFYGEGTGLVRALSGVDLRIDRGEFLAIMGPSGSGNSTAMKILGCLDLPTGGRYLFGGVDVTALGHDQRARLRRNFLGFVFQGYNLLAHTTAIENVELPLVYRGTPKRERREQAARVLHLVGLRGREHHTPAELSGGQQQRVAIARAIVADPCVLLADEPTGNLDTARSHEIMELLVRLNGEQGLTIIMVTHEPDMAAFAHRTVRFLDGRIESDLVRQVVH